MSERDPMPAIPPCPVCDSTDQVRRHDTPHQGRWLCMREMLLFDGTSAEWLRPTREPAGELDENGLAAARAALEEAKERAGK